ncbi:hypothetical protein EMIHUDRAFT_249441 [Emiliania huxleyi CCMP1516]|uniref:SGNH hydrolase-type esterase domain-containing protein n=2 Tax=Emiliania huxleyi TaxID=2903 RepID=A0A0D3I8N7_EMIH1|nr:hypothetical protein EMIHUDRAFT_249441 [Emiliania huxleyi CCMP1516]EOD07622.1 hypothetical protein EMIHUDRAFT_249441 [Emiliania huxleyi CCMP1516]|eukprot:XP_005760051.1 hypothetical protein EMIHUDRAFT_249441 [Emiliania huxleyi CCMP1516]
MARAPSARGDLVVFGGSVSFGRGSRRAWTEYLDEEMNISSTVWAHPAVLPNYFQSCMRRYLRPDTASVLIEFEPNLQAASCTNAVTGLVRSVRAIAPSASILFVGWPSLRLPFRACEAALERDLRQEKADKVFASPLRRMANATAYYADDTHPNDAGGRYLAHAVASFLRAKAAAPPRTGSGAGTPSPPLPATAARTEEVCEGAGALNATARGWTLVGPSDHEHYESTTIGAALDVPVLPLGACAAATVELSYTRSWRTAGSFCISCNGCMCGRRQGQWARAAHPFPCVSTLSATISTQTFKTSFNVLTNGSGRPCVVRLVHRSNKTRVHGMSVRRCVNGFDARRLRWNTSGTCARVCED